MEKKDNSEKQQEGKTFWVIYRAWEGWGGGGIQLNLTTTITLTTTMKSKRMLFFFNPQENHNNQKN